MQPSLATILKKDSLERLTKEDWKVISPSRKNSAPDPSLLPFQPTNTSSNIINGAQNSPTSSQWNGWHGNSIWDAPNTSSPHNTTPVLIAPFSNQPRQYRSNSTSSPLMDPSFIHRFSQITSPLEYNVPLKRGEEFDETPSPLPQDYLSFGPQQQRSRSKSSSALVYGGYKSPYLSPLQKSLHSPTLPQIPAGSVMQYPSQNIGNHSYNPTPTYGHNNSGWEHRRSSTTPSHAIWEDSPQLDNVLYQEHIDGEFDAFEKLNGQRRFSHAPPNFYQEYIVKAPPGDFGDDAKRRHSMAGYTQLERGMRDLTVVEQQTVYANINDYFENKDHRAKAWVEAGKNLGIYASQQGGEDVIEQEGHTNQFPIYVIEFKAGRRDFFYLDKSQHDKNKISIKTGDLMIVEADRGKDLGKVICDCLMSMDEVAEYQKNHPDILSESPYSGKDIVPKKVFRKASHHEISLLVPKSLDEMKAMEMCRGKIKAKKLPMEIVDAEYQWYPFFTAPHLQGSPQVNILLYCG